MPKHCRFNTYKFEPVIWNIFKDVDDNDFTPLVKQILESTGYTTKMKRGANYEL
jgi:hypothetical protein